MGMPPAKLVKVMYDLTGAFSMSQHHPAYMVGSTFWRFCYKLPDILPVSGMSAEDQLQLEMRLSSIIKFVQKNEASFFLSPAAAAPE